MIARITICLIVTAALGALPDTALAQDRALLDRLRNAVRIDCRFTSLAKGEWTEDGTTFSVETPEFTAAFFDIDVESGTAEAEGRFGDSYIIVRYAEGYLHFMQTQSSGPLYLTTVFAQPTEDGKLKAVHTRHEYTQVSLPGFTSRPEMYLGDCSVAAAED
jgi:hypothetical protein